MKMQKVGFLIGVMLMAGSTVFAEESEAPAAEAALSGDWADYQIQVDDQVYQFPMMFSDFTAYGWTCTDEEYPVLEPNQYDMMYFTKDDVQCTAYVLNLGMNNESAENCIVGGMAIDGYDWDVSVGTVTLAGGIVRGQADEAAIEAAYGTPSDTYEGELYTSLTYETDLYSSVELSIDAESGVLEDIDIRNFVEPEGFDAGEASTEVPETVTAYAKPDSLGDSFDEYRIALDGELYTLPVPVSVLVADGWEIDENDTDAEIAANYFGWVTLRKGGQEIRQTIVNSEDYATVPENCWIETLTVGGYTLEAEGEIPCGIRPGMTEADMIQALETAGAAYTSETNGDFAYYTINEKSYDKCYELIVYKGEDGHFEKDTVMEVTCSNPVGE